MLMSYKPWNPVWDEKRNEPPPMRKEGEQHPFLVSLAHQVGRKFEEDLGRALTIRRGVGSPKRLEFWSMWKHLPTGGTVIAAPTEDEVRASYFQRAFWGGVERMLGELKTKGGVEMTFHVRVENVPKPRVLERPVKVYALKNKPSPSRNSILAAKILADAKLGIY